jgi:hypothetical protein
LHGRIQWEKNVLSNDQRFQSFVSYGEAGLQAIPDELRMEVYLRYMRQVEDQQVHTPEKDLFLSFGNGRKPAIAASVSATLDLVKVIH